MKVVIIGAGVFGLMTAYQLIQKGVKEIILIEQFQKGHRRGSSHGASRIFRHFYDEPHFIHLAFQARDKDWPSLEKVLDRQILTDCPGLAFGKSSPHFNRYIEAFQTIPMPFELLDIIEAKKRFPQFSFVETDHVLFDPKAAVIKADELLQALIKYCIENGVSIFENTKVEQVESSKSLSIRTSEGTITADKVVVTAGPWITKLFPINQIETIRQSVGYFTCEEKVSVISTGNFPVWAWIGQEKNDIFYGIPQFGTLGLKVARHITEGRQDDPDCEHFDAKEPIETVTAFAKKAFCLKGLQLVRSETCFYTCTPNSNFILDYHPEDARIIIGTGFTGHGFKFAPTIGKILANLALNGSFGMLNFESFRKEFSFNN